MKKALLTCSVIACAVLTACGGGGDPIQAHEASGPIQLTAQKAPAFGNSGTVKPDVAKLLKPLEQLVTYETAGVAQDAYGRIVVVGQFAGSSTASTAFVARFQPDGRPDLTCGGLGVAALFGLAAGESMGQVRVAAAGQMLALRHNASGALVRINEACDIDAGFGRDGAARLPEGVMDLRAFDVDALGAVIGVSESSVMKFTRDGHLDTTFATLGVAKIAYPADASTSLDDVAINPDGSSVLGAMVRYGGGAVQSHFAAVARITPSGAIDGAFGKAGWAASLGRFETAGDFQRTSVASLPDGSTVLVWGGRQDGRGQVAMSMKVSSAGQLASGFGNQGISSWTVPGGEHTVHKQVVADGSSLLVCGDINPSSIPDRQAAYAMRVDALSGAVASVVGIANPDINTHGNGDSGFYKTCRGLSSRAGRTVMSVGVAASNTKPVVALINF